FDLIYSLDDELGPCEFATRVQACVLHGAYLAENGVRRYTESARAWFDMGLLRPEDQGGKVAADELKRRNRKTFQDIYADIFDIGDCSDKRPILVLHEADKGYG